MNGVTERFDRRLLAGLLCACAALGGLAGSAAGQAAQAPAAKAPVAKAKERRIVTIQQHEDGRSFSVKLEDGRVSAQVDGQPVPEDRIRREEGRLEILDEHGQPLTVFMMDEAPGGGAGLFGRRPGEEGGEFAIALDVEGGPAPKVMVGINMSDPPEILRRHLGLEEGQAALIDRVIDGLPAAEAGLEAGDIIVEVEGDAPGSAERLREVLAEREPGDELRLTVIHRGQRKQVKLKLQPYQAERLGAWFAGEEGVRAWGSGAEARRYAEQARRMAEQALRERRALTVPPAPDAPEPPMVFTPHALERYMGDLSRRPALDARLAEVDERLSALDEKLNRIEEALARLAERRPDR